MKKGLKCLVVAVLCGVILFITMTDGMIGDLNRVQASKKDELQIGRAHV